MPEIEVHPADGTVPVDALTKTGGEKPDNACVNYEQCGNVVPGNGQICGSCLDEARHNAPSSS